jgi:plastocyanin
MPRLAAVLLAIALAPLAASGAGEPEFKLVIENHAFTPDRLEVPAGKKVKLLVENRDASAEEFESEALKIEKVIAAKGKGTVYVGPLKPGEYKFIGEYHEKTAHGVVVAK